MPEPIVCPQCKGINWKTEWSGIFSEDQNLTWQHYVITPRYELTFDNEDQYATDTERWQCTGCGHEPNDEIQYQLNEQV